jgi:hypothetical protein
MKELKTSEEWQKECKDILIVLDADGWDRKNFQYSWYEEKISKQEFCKRTSTSTVQCDVRQFVLWSERDTAQQKENDLN